MITLRENQSEPIAKAIQFFQEAKPKPSLIVLPTAWGKSILTAFVAKNTTDRLLVLQPSKELLEQNYRKYCTLCGDFGCNAGIYSASFGRREIAQITYATIGSIKNLGETFKRYGFTKMLIDEAHLYPREADSMLGRFLKDSGITHVLGITATPVKLQTNRDRDGQSFSKLVMLTSRSKKGNFYKDIIHVGQVQEMVRLGFWSPLQYEETGFDDSLLVFNSSKSEYTEDSVQRAYDANGGTQGVIDALDKHSERKHVLAFVPSVSDAISLSERYPNSAVIYGEQDKREREQTVARFRAGEIRVLFNVRVLSTGFRLHGNRLYRSRNLDSLYCPVLSDYRSRNSNRPRENRLSDLRPRGKCLSFRTRRGHRFRERETVENVRFKRSSSVRNPHSRHREIQPRGHESNRRSGGTADNSYAVREISGRENRQYSPELSSMDDTGVRLESSERETQEINISDNVRRLRLWHDQIRITPSISATTQI